MVLDWNWRSRVCYLILISLSKECTHRLRNWDGVLRELKDGWRCACGCRCYEFKYIHLLRDQCKCFGEEAVSPGNEYGNILRMSATLLQYLSVYNPLIHIWGQIRPWFKLKMKTILVIRILSSPVSNNIVYVVKLACCCTWYYEKKIEKMMLLFPIRVSYWLILSFWWSVKRYGAYFINSPSYYQRYKNLCLIYW